MGPAGLQGAVIDRILRDNYRAPFPGPDRDFGGPPVDPVLAQSVGPNPRRQKKKKKKKN